jgi:hypothetical protein
LTGAKAKELFSLLANSLNEPIQLPAKSLFVPITRRQNAPHRNAATTQIKDPLERIMNTTSQATGSKAVIPVDAINAATGELSQDSLLNDLLSGLEDVVSAAPVSLMEQDMLALLDVEAPMTLAVAGAVIEVPEELTGPAPTMGDAVRAGLKAESKKNAAADKKATNGKATPKAGDKTQKAAPKAGKGKAADTETPTVNAEEPENVKALTGAEPGESSPEVTTEPAKKTAAPRMTFALKSEKIVHKLGDKAKEFLILDAKDAELSDEELAAKQAAVLAAVDQMAIKIGEKAVMLMNFLKNGGKLNEIMKRTFTVLIRDGFLTSGAKGNLVTNFELKPYSPGTAASQSNQMFGLFPALGICHEKSAGRMELNEDSTILIKMKAELGL